MMHGQRASIESCRGLGGARHHRFTILLATILGFLLLLPVLDLIGLNLTSGVRGVLVAGLFNLLLVATVLAVSERPKTIQRATFLAAPAFLFQILELVLAYPWVYICGELLAMAFLAYAGIVILRFVFSSSRVTFNTISAALCVYLLMGIWWSSAYALLDVLEYPEVAFDPPVARSLGGTRDVGSTGEHGEAASLYFSLVTLTTLGYGDIRPVSAAARMSACVEAILGQLFLTVLVARLVGLEISQGTKRRQDEDG